MITEKQIIDIVTESIKKNFLNEEDGRMPYISDVLNRFGVRFNYDDTKELIVIQYENSLQKRDIVNFLAQMGYVINNEDSSKHIVSFNRSKALNEDMSKKDVMDIIKKDKDFEKRIKEITAGVVTELFRVLWQHNAIFKNLSK